MVTSYRIKQVAKASHPDLDSLEQPALLAELAKEPWTTWEIQLEVSDPVWLEHLAQSGAYHYNFSRMNAVKPWTGAPIKWQGSV